MELRKLLKHRALGHAGALGSASAIMALCGFLTNIIWARWMPQEVYGGFKVIFTLVNLAGAFCLLGAGQTALMSAAQNADGNLVRLIRAKLLANAGGSLLLLTAAGYYVYSADASVPIAYGLLVTALLFPAYNISDIWTSWLNGKARFRDLATGRALTYILPLFSVATVAILGVSELWQIAFLYFVLTSVQNAVMLRKITALRSSATTDEGILQHGRHTAVAMMFGSVVVLDVVILNHYYSPAEVAVYAVAFVLPELLKSFLVIINQMIAPKVSNGRPLIEFWREFRGLFLALTTGLVVLGVAGFFFLPAVVPLLFSDKYVAAAQYSKWLWLVMASLGSLGLLGNALIATKKLVFTYGTFVGYPILLCAMYFLFATDGVAGMVTARILAMVGLHLFYAVGFFLSIRLVHENDSQS